MCIHGESKVAHAVIPPVSSSSDNSPRVCTAWGRIAPNESTENNVAVLSSTMPVDIGLS